MPKKPISKTKADSWFKEIISKREEQWGVPPNTMTNAEHDAGVESEVLGAKDKDIGKMIVDSRGKKK